MDVDMQTQEVLQMVSEGARLTVNLINHVFRTLADTLEKDGNEAFIDKSTREGKQKINNLIKKHKDGVKTLDENLTKEQVKDYQKQLKKLGVDFSVVKNGRDNYSFFFAGSQADVVEKALKNVVELKEKVQDNEQVKEAKLDLETELKDTTELEQENASKAYSKYIERQESGEIPEREELSENEKILFDKLKNLDETEKEVQEKIQNEMDLELEEISNQKEEVISLVDEEIETLNESINDDNLDDINNEMNELKELKERVKEVDNLDELSIEDKEQLEQSFNKKIDELEKEVKSIDEEINSMSKQENVLDKDLNDLNEKRDELQSDIDSLKESQKELPTKESPVKEVDTKDKSRETLNSRLNELSDKELELFEKKMEYENIATAPVFNESETYKLADELTELKSSFSKESIDKVNSIDKDIRSHDNSDKISKGEKLNANEILKETKEHSSERKSERKKEQKYSIDNVKKLDNKINNKEKDEKKINRNNKVEHTL